MVLELGYFLAKLGRKNVMPLYEDGVELPSDISGVLYTKVDNTESWKYSLVKEQKTAGFIVDSNNILWKKDTAASIRNQNFGNADL